VNRQVDTSRPMFTGRSHGVRGGGAFDPTMVLLALIAVTVAWRARS
jgi:hypothetical protein